MEDSVENVEGFLFKKKSKTSDKKLQNQTQS